MAKKDFSIEDSFVELENIVKQLENDEISLNDALAMYSKGVVLLNKCKDNLEDVEKEIIVLSEKGGKDHE